MTLSLMESHLNRVQVPGVVLYDQKTRLYQLKTRRDERRTWLICGGKGFVDFIAGVSLKSRDTKSYDSFILSNADGFVHTNCEW